MRQAALAKSLGVSDRTLRNWIKLAIELDPPKLGRPKLTEEDYLCLKEQVRSEWNHQGRPGWRPVKAALPEITTRVVQRAVREFKEELRARNWQHKRYFSKRLRSDFKNVIWSQDTTFENKKAFEVIKDRATFKYVGCAEIESTGAVNIVHALDNAIKKEGVPLVLMTDNGSGYKSEIMEKYLKEKSVIHLRSLPRCPQHNGAAENGIRELKRVRFDLKSTYSEAVSILNKNRRWGSKNYQTSEEIEARSTIKIDCELRQRIYDSYNKKMLKLEKQEPNLRKRKLLEREMVFELLENEGLIKTFEGSQNMYAKAEVFL